MKSLRKSQIKRQKSLETQIKQNKPNVNKTKSEIRNQTELPSCSRVQKDEVGGVYLSLGQAKVGANKRTINKQLSTSLSLSLTLSGAERGRNDLSKVVLHLWIMNTLLKFSWQQKIITQWLIFICTVATRRVPFLSLSVSRVTTCWRFLLLLVLLLPLKKAFNLDLCAARHPDSQAGQDKT